MKRTPVVTDVKRRLKVLRREFKVHHAAWQTHINAAHAIRWAIEQIERAQKKDRAKSTRSRRKKRVTT